MEDFAFDANKKFLICTSVDDNYMWPWLVMVYSSVINSRNRNFKYALANINASLSPTNIEIAREFMQSLQLQFEVIEIETQLQPIFTHQFNLNVYARLFLLDLLEEDFLWLDADLLLRPGWDQIFNELGDRYETDIILYGVQDTEITRAKLSKLRNEAFLLNQERYINSGVIKTSSKAWKNSTFNTDWQEMAMNLKLYGFTYPDQDILNFLCAGKISIIPKGYNHIVGDEISLSSQILIQHYAGSPKPWQLDQKGKEFLMGIQGTKYFSPKDWITQSSDAFIYFPIYWKAESELVTYLQNIDKGLLKEILDLQLSAIKPLNKRSHTKLFLMKILTRKIFT